MNTRKNLREAFLAGKVVASPTPTRPAGGLHVASSNPNYPSLRGTSTAKPATSRPRSAQGKQPSTVNLTRRENVLTVLKRINIVEALSICEATPGPVARLVKTARSQLSAPASRP